MNRPSSNIVNNYLKDLAKGPLLEIETYSGCIINGYKFHSISHGTQRTTMNSGVCIKGAVYNNDEQDFYGRLLEVCVLEYPGLPIKKAIMFKCEWFDSSASGTLVHPEFKLVSINHTRRYKKYEPFVLANQADQVYFCSYPSTNQARKDWWEVCKVKPRFNVEVPCEASKSTLDQAFQEDDVVMTMMGNHIDDDPIPVHPRGGVIEIDEVEEEIDEVVSSSDEENVDEDE